MAEMTLKKIEFSIIKTSVLIFIASVIFVLISFYGIDSIILGAKHEFSAISQTVYTTTDKLHKRLESNSIYQKMHKNYTQLYGFSYAKPDKLRWLEQLKKQAEELKLPSMTYNIKARHLDDQYSRQLSSDLAFYTTEIEFQAGLVHETQLLQLIDLLRQSDLGVFSVEHCALSINGQGIQFAAHKANLASLCMIEWYEIDHKPVDQFSPGINAAGVP